MKETVYFITKLTDEGRDFHKIPILDDEGQHIIGHYVPVFFDRSVAEKKAERLRPRYGVPVNVGVAQILWDASLKASAEDEKRPNDNDLVSSPK